MEKKTCYYFKGLLRNKFAVFTLRFWTDLADPIEQNRRNSCAISRKLHQGFLLLLLTEGLRQPSDPGILLLQVFLQEMP